MEGFVDIHCHILPGVDAGAQNLEQALALIDMAWKDGTTALVLTPHHRRPYNSTPEQLRAAFDVLREHVAGLYPELELHLGSEAAWERGLPEELSRREVLSLGGTGYVLLEFRSSASRARIINGTLEILNTGFLPIIAHAELCDSCYKYPTLIDELIGYGARIQLDADSIMGRHGHRTKRFCHRILKQGKVHFIASDGHDSAERPPLLGACFRRVAKKYGQDRAAELFWANARAVLADESI